MGGLSNFFSPQHGSVKDPVKQQAWGTAQPVFNTLSSWGQNLAASTQANPAYAGQRVADLNGYRAQGADQANAYATGAGNAAVNQLSNVGSQMAGYGTMLGQNAQNLFNYSSMDPTGNILRNAGMYANNPYADQQIDAVNRDVMRGLNEQTLPSLARNAAATGNTNSTRAGVESAIAQRGAADRMADTAANIRSTLFNNGLNAAQNQYNTNISNMLSANNQLYNTYNSGLSALNNASNLASNNFNLANNAGNVYQQQQQAGLDAKKAYFDESLANQLGAYKTIGSVFGTPAQYSSIASTYTDPSQASQLMGGIKSILSF